MRIILEIINDLIDLFPLTAKALFYGLMVYELNLICGLGKNSTFIETTAPSVKQVITKHFTGNNAGDYFIGLCTLAGASLVIFAAIIQANGIKQQVTYEKEKDKRKENMEYLGWLKLSVNDIWRRYMRNQSNYVFWLSIIRHDSCLVKIDPIKAIRLIDSLIPKEFIINERSRHLYIKLPQEINNFLNKQPDPYKNLTTNMHALINAIRSRSNGGEIAFPPEYMQTLTIRITKDWEAFLQSTEDGLTLAMPHIEAMQKQMVTNGFVMPYK